MGKRPSMSNTAKIIIVLAGVLIVFFSLHYISRYQDEIKTGGTVKDFNLYTKTFEVAVENISKNPLDINWSKEILSIAFLVGLGYALIVYYNVTVRKNTMFGKEQGSAKWATSSEERKLSDKTFEKNSILTNSVFLSLNTRKTRKNNNILCIGGSGSGKSRFFAKPNILQANTSYVITDPKGELMKSTAKMLAEKGYEIKVFNLVDMEHSSCYNPFHYINKESDVFKIINCLINNTNPPDKKGGDPFWEKSETALLQAIFFLLWLECVPEHQNFASVMKLLRLAKASEANENFKSKLDEVFDKIEDKTNQKNKLIEQENELLKKQNKKEKPYIQEHIAVKQYKIFKAADGKTAKSILISVGVRLSVFNLESISNLTLTDTLDIGTMGDSKKALFIVIPDSDKSFNFLVAMLYSQLFDELYYQADFGEMVFDKNNTTEYKSSADVKRKKEEWNNLKEEIKKVEGNVKKKDIKKQITEIELLLDKNYLIVPPKDDSDNETKEFLNQIDIVIEKLSNKHMSLCDDFEQWKNYFEADEKGNLLKAKDGKKEDIKIIQSEIKCLYGISFKNKSQFVFECNSLIEELKINEKEFGTKNSFSSKNEKIEQLTVELNNLTQRVKEYSFTQSKKRKEIEADISVIKNKIKLLQMYLKLEFGEKPFKKASGTLNNHVRIILDEFVNIGKIPDFQSYVSTMRSREISVSIIIQNLAQIKEMYKDSWENLTGNCDTLLFLGGQEQTTLEYVSKRLGNMTIDKKSTSRSKGKSGSSSQSWDTLKRELMTPDEVGRMSDSDCICFVRGCNPFFTKKYKIERHKNYKLTKDASNSNEYMYDKIFVTKDTINKIIPIVNKEISLIKEDYKESEQEQEQEPEKTESHESGAEPKAEQEVDTNTNAENAVANQDVVEAAENMSVSIRNKLSQKKVAAESISNIELDKDVLREKGNELQKDVANKVQEEVDKKSSKINITNVNSDQQSLARTEQYEPPTEDNRLSIENYESLDDLKEAHTKRIITWSEFTMLKQQFLASNQ